jgi:hypothetical protein
MTEKSSVRCKKIPCYIYSIACTVCTAYSLPTKYIYVYEYLEYRSVCPLVQIRTPNLHSRKRVCPPRNQRGHTRMRMRGWGGGDAIRTTGEKPLALCLLCESPRPNLKLFHIKTKV